jgi:ribosome-binding factor A
MGHRLARVAEVIRSEVSDLLLRAIRDPRVRGLVTVTHVEVSGDLRHAVVYVSVFGSQDEQEAALRGLKSAEAFVRREIARRIRVRTAPAVAFRLDHSIERGSRVLALMKELGLGEAPAPPGPPEEKS